MKVRSSRTFFLRERERASLFCILRRITPVLAGGATVGTTHAHGHTVRTHMLKPQVIGEGGRFQSDKEGLKLSCTIKYLNVVIIIVFPIS